MDRPTLARFMRQTSVADEGDCLLWTGPQISSSGYGKFRVPGQQERPTHVLLWEHFNGPMPVGQEGDHLCKVRLCCNPTHIEPVTPSINVMRQDHAERRVTHCPSGHPYDAENTDARNGRRYCRACSKARSHH